MKTILNVVVPWAMKDACWLKIYSISFFFSYRLQLHMVCNVQRLPAAICLRLNTDCEWLVSAHHWLNAYYIQETGQHIFWNQALTGQLKRGVLSWSWNTFIFSSQQIYWSLHQTTHMPLNTLLHVTIKYVLAGSLFLITAPSVILDRFVLFFKTV